ncbi:hypothetical protein LCGC14_2514850 [marine sediment metagenome]|uniref:Uncharacterized protein n=1 Tax=marine sediment metagenome TaxID=412755 RepID=A0A0F9AYK9_9ZZZZ
MTIRYQKRHYEDVTYIFATRGMPDIVRAQLVGDFADLFAADNPRRCFANEEHVGDCTDGCLTGTGPDNEGFDREQFLATCGLEVGGRIHDGRCGESGCSVCGLGSGGG